MRCDTTDISEPFRFANSVDSVIRLFVIFCNVEDEHEAEMARGGDSSLVTTYGTDNLFSLYADSIKWSRAEPPRLQKHLQPTYTVQPPNGHQMNYN